MKAVMKIVLIAVLVILAILLIFGFVLVMDWPWWVGLFILLAFAGITIGVILLRKILKRRKEQKFVSQVIEQDEARIKAAQVKDKEELTDIQRKWKEAVEALRRSHLRKQGNPLYVLPWYMIIGESGSGKTTALNSAKLSSPFVEVTRTSGISGTKNCDWWFFEQAIIIDTAGRYAIPVDEGRDKEEWQRFMNLLVKYRKREPLNGLIVAVSADKILESPRETLEEGGKNIRRRIDELMRVLGTKFPIYLLITKCDLVQGMSRFCNSLPEKSLDQPMGFINQDLATGMNVFLEQAVNTIVERLRNLRLLLLHQSRAKEEVAPELLLFPEEFENLKQGLGAFVESAFVENPYQETPILRGMFFSSGRQEGTPYSHFLQALELIGEKEVLTGTSKGLFLHDFFSKILPKDRRLLAPTRRAIEWSIFTRNLGLTAWIIFGIAICGLLSFSFVKNIGILRTVSHDFSKPITLQGDFAEATINTERFNQVILNVEKQNRNWWLPRFGLKESIDVEESLKDKYCNQFQKGFLLPIDRQFKENLSHAASASDDVFGQYISQLVRRINLLKGRLNKEELEKLRKRPQPSLVAMVSGSGLDYQARQKFGNLFLYYIYWRSDTPEISKEIDMLRAWLKDLLKLKSSSPQWIILWVNKDGSIPPVTLKDFWGGSLSAPREVTVDPAFSKKGKEAIDSLLNEIEEALDEPSLMERQRMEVDSYYRKNCFDAWQNFAANFPEGSRRLNGKKEWQQAAAKMASEDGPYFALLNRMTVELEPVVTGENIPSWIQQLYQFQTVKNAGAVGAVVTKTTEEGKKLIDAIKQKLGRKIETTSLDSHSAAFKAYQDYQNALSLAAQAATSRVQILQLISLTFSEDPASSGKAPFLIGYSAASRLKIYFANQADRDGVFVRLISAPLEFLWRFSLMEAGCQLQVQWEKEVLAEAQGASSAIQETELLWGREGLAWKFVKGTAAPFISWKASRGYYAKEALGGTIPFENSFLSSLGAETGTRARTATATAASKQQSYKVVISGLPTDANPDASIKPHKSHLELTCDTSPQILENLNYPRTQTFNWTPESCSDVTLWVYAGNATIMKQYTGPQAFVHFLRDFPGGHHTFHTDEFPQQKSELKKAGIKYIVVNYRISGEKEILKNYEPVSAGQMRTRPRSLGNITRCWD